MGWRCVNTKPQSKGGGPCNVVAIGPNPPPVAICLRCEQKPTWVKAGDPSQYNKPILAQAPAGQEAFDQADIVAKRTEFKARMDLDPTAKEVSAVIAANDDLRSNPRLIANFGLFLFLYYARDHLAPRLKASESYRLALEHQFGTDQVLEDADLPLPVGVITEFLAQGWALFRGHWELLTTPPHRLKLIRDIFDSSKGYPKTARALESWQLPGQVNALQLFRDWLSESRNDSIFTGMALVTDEKEKFNRIHHDRGSIWLQQLGRSRDIKQQIERWYDMESKTPGRYAYMWGLFLQKIHDVLGLDRESADHMALLQKYCADHMTDMTTAFARLIGPEEIRQFVVARFAYVYRRHFLSVGKQDAAHG